MLLVVLSPVKRLESGEMADALAKYRLWPDGSVQVMGEDDREMRKAIIARQTAAYISDKAAALGIQDPQVWVQCRLTGEGFPAPESVKVQGSGSEEAWRALQRAITADFGLDESKQTLERMDVP